MTMGSNGVEQVGWSNTPSNQTGRPSKRRRVALACSNCRHRKSRCDGARPKCTLCCEQGCDCVYEQAGIATSLTVGKTYLERLERRLQTIEATLKHVQAPKSTPCSEPSSSISAKIAEAPDRNDGEDDIGLGYHGGTLGYGRPEGIGEVDTAEDSIDGMGAIKFTDEEDWGYFGPTSNIAFLRHISVVVARAANINHAFPTPPNYTGGMSVSRPHPVENDTRTRSFVPSYGRVNIYALPSEERTWTLIREYFQKTGQLLPFIHEESFCATYFEMKGNNFTMARRTWLGLLNIILAMATTLHVEADIETEKRIEESDVYYQRANGLCDKESRRNISLELVQYLLILGQYLQGTQKSVQAWTVHGLAITTAFQLGLHSPKTNKGFPPLECEIRKRVWFGCILLDRTLSMTFGRPSMIPEGYLKLEMPMPNFQVLGQTAQVAPSPQMDGMFYTATIKLYSVMYHIIDTCYGQNLGLEEFRTDSEIISLVLKGEERIEEWKSELVPLQMMVYDQPLTPESLANLELENKITERFFIVLSVRYHNLQILLHRPILEKFLEACGCSNSTKGKKGVLVERLGVSSIETCVNSAMIVISIVRQVVLSEGWRRDLLGAWNYSLFYTFNAGLVIYAAIHVARNGVKGNPAQSARWRFVEDSLPYFNMAIEALENLDRGNRQVERCVTYLSQLTLQEDGSAMPPTESSNSQLNPLSRTSTSAPVPWQVPMEIDLNEFMLDTDLDLFARNFNINSYSYNTEST